MTSYKPDFPSKQLAKLNLSSKNAQVLGANEMIVKRVLVIFENFTSYPVHLILNCS